METEGKRGTLKLIIGDIKIGTSSSLPVGQIPRHAAFRGQACLQGIRAQWDVVRLSSPQPSAQLGFVFMMQYLNDVLQG